MISLIDRTTTHYAFPVFEMGKRTNDQQADPLNVRSQWLTGIVKCVEQISPTGQTVTIYAYPVSKVRHKVAKMPVVKDPNRMKSILMKAVGMMTMGMIVMATIIKNAMHNIIILRQKPTANECLRFP